MEIQDCDNYKKPKNTNRKVIKIMLIVLCVLIVGAGVSVYCVYNILSNDNSSSLFLKPTNDIASNNDTQNIINSAAESVDNGDTVVYNGKTYEKNKNIVNLLFLGIDTNKERRVNMAGYRSDMVLVCAVDTVAKKATLISIPRDTYTTVYKIDKKTGEVVETVQQKVNAAYSYGGGASNYSYPNAEACVQMFLERRCELEDPLGFSLDIPVYLHAGIDIDGITRVASAIDGVEITLEKTIPGVGKKGETVRLKYDNAEEYIRNRHDTGGDLDRARRQQKFMIAVAKKIKSMGAVDIIVSLYDDLQKYVTTNLSSNQMLDLAKVLMKTNIDSIEKYTIEGTGDTKNGTYYFYHDEQSTLELLLKVYYQEV